jgi:hypothetical protein
MKTLLHPIHLICIEDESRPNMALISIKNGIVSATNGSVLVKLDYNQLNNIQPEQLEILNGKFIHHEAWKEIHKADIIDFFEDSIDCQANGIKKTFYYTDAVGEFFDLNLVVANTAIAGADKKEFVMYNCKFIDILSKIFDAKELIFSFSGGANGSFVYPQPQSGMFALLMPLVREGYTRYYF